jgi:hypothetical protein
VAHTFVRVRACCACACSTSRVRVCGGGVRVRVHVCVRACVRVCMRACTSARMHACLCELCECVRACACSRVRMRSFSCACAHARLCVCERLHALMHAPSTILTHTPDQYLSIPKFSSFFTCIFLVFLVFLRDYSTRATTVLECSRLSTNVSILRILIVYGVLEAPISPVQNNQHFCSGFFCVTRLRKLHVKGPKFSWVSCVSRDRELTDFAPWL